MHNPPSLSGNRPSGTVTFLFTDIEGSTTRWEHYPLAMKPAVERHDAILRQAIEESGGHVFRTEGDAFRAVFSFAPQALDAALKAQRAIADEPWPQEIAPIRVRMALHTGAIEIRDGDYVGPSLNRMARLLSSASGGQTLLSMPTQLLVRGNLPSDVTLLDMGEHSLKDLIRPEHIFELVVPDLPSEFPPLSTLDNLPNNLPRQSTALIGRERETEAVCSLLRKPDVALITLTGPGGTGKTRLAIQVGAELMDEYPDGVWLVGLAALSDPRLVMSEIAHTLGLAEQGGRPIIDTLRDYLGQKRLLLILDNFEQVLQAANDVSRLLEAALKLKVLVTSRVRLQLRGEHEHPVPALSLPPDLGHLPPLDRLTRYDAVRLFVERATASKPAFEVTNENALAIADICMRLDGLPLAIELAAARIKMLPPQALLARLSQSLKLLTGGARDLPARQQTLRNTIEWSYNLLSTGEKQLFWRMAVFNGGCTLEALEEVCNYDGELRVEVFDGVQSLIDQSLLQQREGREGGDGEPRFWMLETIHEYAREKLGESGEAEAVQREHALSMMALAEEAEPHLTVGKQAEWLNKLEEEHDNIRAALRWVRGEDGSMSASGGRSRVEAGLRIAGALSRFWYVRGYLSEGREELAEMLQVGRGPESVGDPDSRPPTANPSFRAKALKGAGNLAYSQGDYAAARSLHEESLAICRQLGDKRGIANSLNNLGNVAYSQGDYAAARSLYEESLASRRALGDKWGIAISLSNLGLVAYSQGDYATARSLHEESLAICRQLGDKRGISYSLHNLGTVAYSQGDYAAARSLLAESLTIRRELGDKRGIANSLNSMGTVAYLHEDYAAARSLYEESLTIRRELGDKRGCAECLAGLGGVAAGMGQAQAQTQAEWAEGAEGAEEAEGQAQRGARLLGAAEALLGAISAVLDPEDRMVYEQGVASARAQLSKEDFERARAEGQAMSMEGAVVYAMEDS